ncbi:GBF-interacting protein 1 isoform X2 [Silene latifolia]|uniref:GBF-interacting protein 1 isoform X2 n=1 Tax=Silene latifolia TaxID=37657 RepID=UPI003D76DF49
MSSGIKASSIPNNVKKMIQNLKEIYLNHTDDEIYSMLKECNMDPNETAQKLLHQDTFHEVKRKRERKSETNREIVNSTRSGPPGRGGRGGRGYHSSHFSVQDAGDARNTGKENGFNHTSSRAGTIPSLPAAQEGKRKDKGSSVIDVANGPIGVLSGENGHEETSNVLPGSVTKQTEASSRPRSRSGGIKREKVQSTSAATLSNVCSSVFDPVLVPTSDTRVPAVGAIKREVGIQRSAAQLKTNVFAEHKSNASKLGGKSHGAGKNQATEVLQSSSLNHGGSSSSRPSSNYGSRSQQGMGSQKVGPNKEWKPKPTNTNAVPGPKAPPASECSTILLETSTHSQPIEKTVGSEEVTNKLQQELENLHVRDGQHVIIPSHIHVPDAVRTGLSFGSFDTAFVVSPKHSTEPENKDSKSISVAHQGKDDLVEEQATSCQNTLTPEEEVEPADCSSMPEQAETLSSIDVSAPSSSVPDFSESKETAVDPQNSSVHISASYSFDVMPPMLGNQLGQMGGSETQGRDVSRAPGVVVQQPVDPSSFYAQFYRPASENDGRVSPFANHGVASKYTVLSSQTSQSLSEGGNSMGLPTVAPPLATHTAGVMPSSMAQQPLPIFRQPAGIHMPHYPPNFIPYSHYFSPFYVQPPAMHQYLGNNAFPQQSQAGNLYPPPPPGPAAPTAVKFPLSQYKPGNNAGNSAHMSVGGGYGPYGPTPVGFNPGPPPAPGNQTSNEDLAASQFKDNVYITGQQTEGTAVWFPGPGRDMSSLPVNAFYNLPQGQHATYAPTQAAQGAYGGVFHPAQAGTVHSLLQQSQAMPGPGAVDMVGPTGNIYQQPQHSQMNWPNNY